MLGFMLCFAGWRVRSFRGSPSPPTSRKCSLLRGKYVEPSQTPSMTGTLLQ